MIAARKLPQAANISPLPGPAALAGLQLWIESIIDARLKAAGATATTPDPRSLRIAKGLALTEAAELCGVSQSTLSRLEAGKIRRPTPDTLNRIARGLGIPEQHYRQSVAAMLQREAR